MKVLLFESEGAIGLSFLVGPPGAAQSLPNSARPFYSILLLGTETDDLITAFATSRLVQGYSVHYCIVSYNLLAT